VVNTKKAKTKQGTPMRVTVTWRSNRNSATRGDLLCRPVIKKGPKRKVTVIVADSCRLRVTVTYRAAGTRTYMAYKNSFTYKV